MQFVQNYFSVLYPYTHTNSGNELALVAQAAIDLRRPCDPEHPMLIVHIDTRNYADPAKIIETISESI